jgi:RNA polymerase sigma-70 factor (ECF subfamily)
MPFPAARNSLAFYPTWVILLLSPLLESLKLASEPNRTRYVASPRLLAAAQRLREGDRSALNQVILEVQDRLYRFCLYLASDEQLAEELCQETLIRALGNIADLKEPRQIFAWLFKVARNLFIDHHRTPEAKLIALQKQDHQDNDDSNDPGLLASLPDPATASGQECLISVRETLSRLTMDQREVLLLMDHQEFSVEEAARILGLTENALKSRLHRARKAFVQSFGGQQE